MRWAVFLARHCLTRRRTVSREMLFAAGISDIDSRLNDERRRIDKCHTFVRLRSFFISSSKHDFSAFGALLCFVEPLVMQRLDPLIGELSAKALAGLRHAYQAGTDLTLLSISFETALLGLELPLPVGCSL